MEAQSRKAGSHPVTAPADLSRHHRATVLQSRKPFISDGKPAMNLNRKGLFFILKAERLQQDAERKFKYSVFHRRVEVYYFFFFQTHKIILSIYALVRLRMEAGFINFYIPF